MRGFIDPHQIKKILVDVYVKKREYFCVVMPRYPISHNFNVAEILITYVDVKDQLSSHIIRNDYW